MQLTPLHNPSLFILLLFAYLVSGQSDDDCRVPADPDILGLGVRLGLYFQIATTLLIGANRPEEGVESILPTGLFVASFLLAVCYSIIRNKFPPGSIISCTWYPILITIFMPFDLLRRYSKSYHEPWVMSRRTMGFILYVVSLSINVWFWYRGVDLDHPEQCIEPKVFFFANLSAYGNVRTFFKIATVGLLALEIISYLWGFCTGFWRGFWEGFEHAERIKLAEQVRIQNSLTAVSQTSETRSITEVAIPSALTTSTSSEARPRKKPPLWVIVLDVLREWHYSGKTIISQPDTEMGDPRPLPPTPNPSLATSVSTIEISRPANGFWYSIWHGFCTFWICVYAFVKGFCEGFYEGMIGQRNGDDQLWTPDTIGANLARTTSDESEIRDSENTTTEPISPAKGTVPPTPSVNAQHQNPSTFNSQGIESTEAAPNLSRWQRSMNIAMGLHREILSFIFYIVASELQLKWNHLDGINSIDSTGQIIPLALGTFSLIRALYILQKG